MRFGWGLLALLLLLGSQAAAQTVTPDTSSVQGQFYTTFVVGGGGPGNGQASGLLISSAQATSITDVQPVSQFYSGWTWDVTLKGVTPAGSLASYSLGSAPTPSSNSLHLTDTRPGYSCTTGGCTPNTVATTVYAVGPLRETLPERHHPERKRLVQRRRDACRERLGL